MRALVLLVAVLLAVPAVTHAQLGRLRNAVARQAGVTSDVKTGNVAFGGAVVEITEPRVNRLVAGLEAEAAKAREIDALDVDAIRRRNEARREQHDRAMREWERKREERERCLEPHRQRMEASAEGNRQAMGLNEEQQASIERRIAAAQQRGDLNEIQRLADSLSKAMMAGTTAATQDAERLTAEARAACGDGEPEPAEPAYEPEPDYSTVRAAGAAASGMEGDVYAMMRERVVGYVASNGRSSGGMMLTEAEVEVLKANLERLTPYKELLQGA